MSKLANDGDRTVDVGASVPWDLTFRNTGTGYLTVAELRDTLPSTLVWTGETAPVVTTAPDGRHVRPGHRHARRLRRGADLARRPDAPSIPTSASRSG